MHIINNNSRAFLNKYRDILVCLFLVMVTLAVYWQVESFDFVLLDDTVYVVKNQHVRDGMNTEAVKWSFTNTKSGMWIPLVWLSYMAGNHLHGNSPGWHHLTNLFLHLANVLMLFLLLKRMTDTLWQSALAAALFALHPLHVESVAWITERKDVLSTFFLLLTIWAYARYIDRPGIGGYFLAVIFYSCSLMAKPMLVTLPFVLILLDFWPLGRFQLEQPDASGNTEKSARPINLIVEKLPFFVLSATVSVVTVWMAQRYGIIKSMNDVSLTARIGNALVSYASYIIKMIWPSKLAVLYPLPETLPLWKVSGAVVLLTAVSLFAIGNIRQRPYLTVGWLWYLGTLVPVIGLLQAGDHFMPDRFVYVPFMGLYIMIAWGFFELTARWPHRKVWRVALISVLTSILMTVTWNQVGYWKNSITLFEHILEVTSNNWVAHNNFGVALFKQGQIDEAISNYQMALRYKPDYALAHTNLGIALAESGSLEEAAFHLKRALQINPQLAIAHFNTGAFLAKQNNAQAAMAHFAETIRIDPEYVEAYNFIGVILEAWGKYHGARTFFSKATRIDPGFLEAQENLENLNRIHGIEK